MHAKDAEIRIENEKEEKRMLQIKQEKACADLIKELNATSVALKRCRKGK